MKGQMRLTSLACMSWENPSFLQKGEARKMLHFRCFSASFAASVTLACSSPMTMQVPPCKQAGNSYANAAHLPRAAQL